MNLDIEKQTDKEKLQESKKNNLNDSRGQATQKNEHRKAKRPDAANEVIAIEKKLGIKNDLIMKANMYSLVGLILVVCGLSAPVFVLVGIVAEGLSIKVMLSNEFKRQKLWHKCIINYAKGMYNQAKVLSSSLPEEDRKGEAYKIFINMVDSAINAERS